MHEQPTSERPATLSRCTTMAVSAETFLARTRTLGIQLGVFAMVSAQGVTAANPIVQLTHANDILLVMKAISSFTSQNSVTQCQVESFTLSVQNSHHLHTSPHTSRHGREASQHPRGHQKTTPRPPQRQSHRSYRQKSGLQSSCSCHWHPLITSTTRGGSWQGGARDRTHGADLLWKHTA